MADRAARSIFVRHGETKPVRAVRQFLYGLGMGILTKSCFRDGYHASQTSLNSSIAAYDEAHSARISRFPQTSSPGFLRIGRWWLRLARR